MNIKSLDYFRKIADSRSISRVAENSYISQSALSQKIKKLEDQLGVKLFIRSNRGVKLTRQGQIVRQYSDNILETYNRMTEQLNRNREQSLDLKIEAVETIATYCLPCALYRIKEKFPTHNYELISGNSGKIKQDVLNDICDLGFVTDKPAHPDLSALKLVDERVMAVAHRDFQIPDRIQLKNLNQYPLILLAGECVIKNELKHNLDRFNLNFNELNILFQLESSEAIKTQLSRGYGISILPYSSVKEELENRQFKTITIQQLDINYSMYLIYKQEGEFHRQLQELIQEFRELDSICC
ncbi:MAG: LysR family transcriptional regulator [Bacillota bacterium]